jgi:hypothetical protein
LQTTETLPSKSLDSTIQSEMDGMNYEKGLIMSIDGALEDVLDAARSMAVSEQDLSQGTDAQHVHVIRCFV